MLNQYTYGYLKEAVYAHLDLEEDEVEANNISKRFHIFANEAMQQICHSKPKYEYFVFEVVASFTPLVYDDGELREATEIEQTTTDESIVFASDIEMTAYYNALGIYLVGQVMSMPDDFLMFAEKKAFIWSDSITNRIAATSEHFSYLSNTEIVPYYIGTYMIPYQAIWLLFKQADEDETVINNMPSDLLLTIPIYVASLFLQKRDASLARAKREEFEIAVNRCKLTTFLENKDVSSSFE